LAAKYKVFAPVSPFDREPAKLRKKLRYLQTGLNLLSGRLKGLRIVELENPLQQNHAGHTGTI
jgi:hypothetical protein